MKTRLPPKPVVAVPLILSETVLLPTLAENVSCVKVKPVGRERWATPSDASYIGNARISARLGVPPHLHP